MLYEKTLAGAEKIVRENVADNDVIDMFLQCYKDTLNNTTKILPDDTVFMTTGDIPAMWLRDSTCQLRPYLPFINEDNDVQQLVRRVIKKQIKSILTDPYANASNETANNNKWDDDLPPQKPEVWEQKYELDSLCFPIQLAHQYWKYTKDTSIFDDDFKKAISTIIGLWKVEQHHKEFSKYTFERPSRNGLMLRNNGQGTAVGYTGMTWSGFRPSDSACTYHYSIPSNYFAVRASEIISEFASQIFNDVNLTLSAMNLSKEIKLGIDTFGVVNYNDEQIFAYEVDGLGNHVLMDDSNMPSLLSLPLLNNISPHNTIYKRTRDFILSDENPYYFRGKSLTGVGSEHTRNDFVWPLALAVEGLTSTSRKEKWKKIKMIVENDDGTKLVHESVNPNDPTDYTRPWFSWGNSMFCELVLDYCGQTVKHK